MPDFGITAFGAYIPKLRIDRELIADAHSWMTPSLKSQARGSRAFCSWDEDAITMAVEAGRNCLGNSDKSKIKALFLASTTLPYADLQNSSIVTSALMLGHDIRAVDIAHSQRASTSGLQQAIACKQDGLFIASDRPAAKPASVQELRNGAGAAAFRLGSEGIIARLVGSGNIIAPFVDHFRASDTRHDYFWEERWIRDEGYLKLVPKAIESALTDAGLDISDISHFVMPTTIRGADEAVARRVGFKGKIADNLVDGCGYTGTAHPLLMLVSVLEGATAGERILVIGFGQGADALIFQTTETITSKVKSRGLAGSLRSGLDTDSYLRMLSFYDNFEPEVGMRAEKDRKPVLTEQYRSADQVASFIAGQCQECSAVQFPQLAFCVKCRAPSEYFKPVALAEEKFEVMTYTADWLSYHPAPPLYVGFVQFENGVRLLMEMVDIGPEGIEVGAPLRAVFRIKEKDKLRGYSRYFWKATPSSSVRN